MLVLFILFLTSLLSFLTQWSRRVLLLLLFNAEGCSEMGLAAERGRVTEVRHFHSMLPSPRFSLGFGILFKISCRGLFFMSTGRSESNNVIFSPAMRILPGGPRKKKCFGLLLFFIQRTITNNILSRNMLHQKYVTTYTNKHK